MVSASLGSGARSQVFSCAPAPGLPGSAKQRSEARWRRVLLASGDGAQPGCIGGPMACIRSSGRCREHARSWISLRRWLDLLPAERVHLLASTPVYVMAFRGDRSPGPGGDLSLGPEISCSSAGGFTLLVKKSAAGRTMLLHQNHGDLGDSLRKVDVDVVRGGVPVRPPRARHRLSRSGDTSARS